MLRCADGSLYTGVTTDVLRRWNEHNGGPRGAATPAPAGRWSWCCAWRCPTGPAPAVWRRVSALPRARKERLIRAVTAG
ncbi:GIY-YIG nuclease family protein [Alcanivorax sp. IO_7]|nr:GIY-YIG nuclease family protein [Alcanivorax sp. IO_7]